MGGEAGKGDTYRPVDMKKWSDNFDKIFGKKDVKDFHKHEDKMPEPKPEHPKDDSGKWGRKKRTKRNKTYDNEPIKLEIDMKNIEWGRKKKRIDKCKKLERLKKEESY